MAEANEIKVPGGTIIGFMEAPPELIESPEPEAEKPAQKKRTKKSVTADEK